MAGGGPTYGPGEGHFYSVPWAKQGELVRAFAGLEVIADAEGDGRAWLLARRPVDVGA